MNETAGTVFGMPLSEWISRMSVLQAKLIRNGGRAQEVSRYSSQSRTSLFAAISLLSSSSRGKNGQDGYGPV